jgi:hypothetical protein
MAFGDDEREDRRRRDDAEEERHYWESIEDDQRADQEREAARRDAAIEKMETWFFEQFEDPQSETPRDSEAQAFIYPWGGPFDASDVLHGSSTMSMTLPWFRRLSSISSDGTIEWAPTSSGDFYEHPDPEPDSEANAALTAALTGRILERLDRLEEIVAALPGLPGNIGHNVPPSDVGLPPYGEGDAAAMASTIAETRVELAQAEPDPARLASFSRHFDGWGRNIGAWLVKKGDLAVDEFIKNGVKVVTWTGAFALFSEVARDLIALAQHLLARL